MEIEGEVGVKGTCGAKGGAQEGCITRCVTMRLADWS